LSEKLEETATKVRRHVVEMTCQAGSGHPGGSLSITDVLVALYFKHMKHKPSNPSWDKRDRLVLSKGHAAPALYATLAEAGYFPKKVLNSLRQPGSILQGHPDHLKVPGVEVSTGSLGQGLSIANGMALAAKLDKQSWRVYCILGDGELQEGQVWEAAMAANKYKLDNLTVFVDRNMLQIDGNTEDIMPLEPLHKKWRSFGWHVQEINGNSIPEIIKALEQKQPKGHPRVIIASTVKGEGVSFMENQVCFHGKAPTEKEKCQALKELKCSD
jgi:transketolase